MEDSTEEKKSPPPTQTKIPPGFGKFPECQQATKPSGLDPLYGYVENTKVVKKYILLRLE